MEKSLTLTTEQYKTLEACRQENGRNWKSQLRRDWDTGKAYGELQQIRNSFGPSWLTKFNFNDMTTWSRK